MDLLHHGHLLVHQHWRPAVGLLVTVDSTYPRGYGCEVPAAFVGRSIGSWNIE